MCKPTQRLIAALITLFVLVIGSFAQTFIAMVADFNFGIVSLSAGAVKHTVESVNLRCRRRCLTFGDGRASKNASPLHRNMVGAIAAFLAYELRLLGDGPANGTLAHRYAEDLILAGSGKTTVPIYAGMISNINALPTGVNSTSFIGASGI